MRFIYPLILIISIFICYYFFKKSKNNNKKNNNNKIEGFNNQIDTTDFNDPQFKFFKVLNDIKISDKIVLENIESKCYLNKQTIETGLKTKIIDILKNVI